MIELTTKHQPGQARSDQYNIVIVRNPLINYTPPSVQCSALRNITVRGLHSSPPLLYYLPTTDWPSWRLSKAVVGRDTSRDMGDNGDIMF